MRVLHLTSGLHTGGAGVLLLRHLRDGEWHHTRHHVAYLFGPHDLRPLFAECGTAPYFVDHRGLPTLPRTILRLGRHVRRLDIDLLHANLPTDRLVAGIVGRLTGCPVVASLHDVEIPGCSEQIRRKGLPGRIRVGLRDRATAVLCHRFVAVSATVREVYVDHRGFPAERIQVVESGVPLERFAASVSVADLERLRLSLGLLPQHRVLLNVGRLQPVKAQHRLLAMMAELLPRRPELRLLIAGEGPEHDRLAAAIQQLGLEDQVLLLGGRTDVPMLLALAEAFLLPSLEEGLGLVVIEAMAAGTPVVVNNLPALRSVLRDGEIGMLTDASDPRLLAACVERLLDEPALRERLAAGAREHAFRRYDIQSSARALETIYRSLVAGRKDFRR